MELAVAERLVLLNVLPREGDLTTLRLVRDLLGELSFSEAEHVAFQITVEDGRATWNQAAEQKKDVEIGATAQKIIIKAFRDLEGARRLRLDFLPLYERFVENGTHTEGSP
jgi:hypothetical protein